MSLTLSLTPRRFTRGDEEHERQRDEQDPGVPRRQAETFDEVRGERRAAAEADVIPEHMTTKQTRNVRKCRPNALCT